MKKVALFCSVFSCMLIAACNSDTSKVTNNPMNESDTIRHELAAIDSLLHDKAFAEAMATELDAAYYKGNGQEAPPFVAPGEDGMLIEKSVREEKIAINLAGFYALECGINYLCEKYDAAPIDWLKKIIEQKAGDTAMLILDRFANATWKAGQPFRGLDRIGRPNFKGASSLSHEEVQKDTRQIIGAAAKLQTSLNPGTAEEQLQQIKTLLHNKNYAYQMAAYMDSIYYAGENKPIPAFISSEEAGAVKKKSFKDEKIASNLAGFYAVECCLNYLVTMRKEKPSSILRSITESSISTEDKRLFARFANATWKAGQPFRSLERITRETFMPFNFLSETDIEKDWVQVKAAAAKLLIALH